MTQELILNLSGRYAAAFGLLANNKPNKVRVDTDYKLSFFDDVDESVANVSFSFDDKQVNFAKVPFTNIVGIDKILAPPPVISFAQAKNHIETPINGSDDVVVERWGTKQWDIRIAGLLIDIENRQYPKEHIRKLIQLFQYNGVVDVFGDQFEDKNIDSIYFKQIAITPIPGYADTVKFNLTAKSINPVGFTLLNPNQ